MNYDPIKELNNEVERDIVHPLLFAMFIGPVCFVACVLIYCYSDRIDAWASVHTEAIGWALVVGSLVGIVRLVKKMI